MRVSVSVSEFVDFVDERQSLTAKEREALAAIARRPVSYGDRRNTPSEWRALLAQGLIFWSHSLVSVTTKGEEVLERVG